MPEIDVYNMEGEVVKKVKLNVDLFEVQFNPQVVSEVVNMYIANLKPHIASTKTKAEVKGGGRKPWRQKGTGRARSGSLRSPLFKGGGVIFGPKPRKKIYSLPKKKKKIALGSLLTDKLRENRLKVVEDISLKEPKTRKLKEFIEKFKGTSPKKTLLVIDSPSENILKAMRNLEDVKLKNPHVLNSLDIINCDWLVMELKSLPILEKRVEEWLNS